MARKKAKRSQVARPRNAKPAKAVSRKRPAKKTGTKKPAKKATPRKKPAKASEGKPGRPSTYSEALADRVCEQLASWKSLVKICEQEGMPCYSTVMNWVREKPEFLEKYVRAREDQADALADEIISIADEDVKTSDAVQRNRLRVEARKWVAAKLLPRKYGDRVGLEHSGPDGAPLYREREVNILVVSGKASPETKRVIDARFKRLND